MTAHRHGLALRIKMSHRYVAHLPMFVEVTLANQAADGLVYMGLTECNPWAPPFPVEVTFSTGTRKLTLPGQADEGLEEAGGGFDLSPGGARTWVLDLSELDTPVAPGAWHCTARWLMRHEHPRWSGAGVVTVEAGRPADVPLLDRLRLLRGADSPSWANLVEDRAALDRPELGALSAKSRRALAPYLVMHRAVHGPEPLSRFPPEQLADLQQGPWASEAAVLRYELAWSRQASDMAQLRSAILAAWPGVAYRLGEIERGAGLLTALRHRVGPNGGNAP